MLDRLLAGLAIWVLLAGCFALSGSPVGASQDVAAPVVFAGTDTPREATVDHEMRARQHHARINMILNTGRLGGSELAATERRLDVIALK